MKTITSANSIYAIAIPGVYTAPQILQQFAADASFATEKVVTAETRIGVDGVMTAGWVPRITPQVISLQADSVSADIFDNWDQAQQVLRDILYATATITIPSIGKKFTLSQGVLVGFIPISDAKRVLDPRTFDLHWGSITAASV